MTLTTGHRGLGMNATNSLGQRGLLALYIYSVYTCTYIYKYLYLLGVFRTWSFLFCENNKDVVVYSIAHHNCQVKTFQYCLIIALYF